MIENTLNAGIPVFVSEWGSGKGHDIYAPPNLAAADKWHAFLDSNEISWCAWAVAASNFYGRSELDFWQVWGNPMNYNYRDLSNWTDPSRMTTHGRYVYRLLTGRDTTVTQTSFWPEFNGPVSRINASGGWYSYHGATSTAANAFDDGAHRLTFTSSGAEHWVGMGFEVTRGRMTQCGYGIGYTYKGASHSLQVRQSNLGQGKGSTPENPNNFDYPMNHKIAPAVNDWTEVRIPWGYFWQRGFGERVNRDSSLIIGFEWAIDATINGLSESEGGLWIKDVVCLGDLSGAPVKRSPVKPEIISPSVKVSGRTLQVRLADSGKVEIFNIKGKKLRTLKLNQGDHVINVKRLSRGTYIINVTSGTSWKESVKMVVK